MPFFRENPNSIKPNIGIGIDIVDGCNVRCKQCYYKKSENRMRILDPGLLKRIIRQTGDFFSELYILGGEPTLHPELKEILETGLSHFETVILVTNGIKLSDESYCQKLALPRLGISMHRRAISDESHAVVDNLYGRKGIFELNTRAWKNVSKLWQGDVCVQLNILKPLIENNCAEEVFFWARKMGYEPIIELTKPGPIFERGHHLDVTALEIQLLFERFRNHDETNFPDQMAKILVPPSYGHNCTLVETGIHVGVDGTVYPCVAHINFPLGSIWEDDLEEMLLHPLRSVIKDYKTWIVGPCRECQFFEYCHGGCRGEALWETGCPRASDPYCWHIPEEATLKDMVPVSCENCLLEDHPGCSLRV